VFGRRAGCPKGYEKIKGRCYPEIKNKNVTSITKIENREDIIRATDEHIEKIKKIYGNSPRLKEYDVFFVKSRNGDLDKIFGYFDHYDMLFEFKVPHT